MNPDNKEQNLLQSVARAFADSKDIHGLSYARDAFVQSMGDFVFTLLQQRMGKKQKAHIVATAGAYFSHLNEQGIMNKKYYGHLLQLIFKTDDHTRDAIYNICLETIPNLIRHNSTLARSVVMGLVGQSDHPEIPTPSVLSQEFMSVADPDGTDTVWFTPLKAGQQDLHVFTGFPLISLDSFKEKYTSEPRDLNITNAKNRDRMFKHAAVFEDMRKGKFDVNGAAAALSKIDGTEYIVLRPI